MIRHRFQALPTAAAIPTTEAEVTPPAATTMAGLATVTVKPPSKHQWNVSGSGGKPGRDFKLPVIQQEVPEMRREAGSAIVTAWLHLQCSTV
jgi:hypothetical protein